MRGRLAHFEPMRLPFKGFALALAAVLLVPVASLLVLTDGHAVVDEPPSVTTADVDRAVAAMRQVSASLQQSPGAHQSLRVAEHDLAVWSLYAVRQRLPVVRTQVRVDAGKAQLRASWPWRIGRWVNVTLELQQAAGLPQLTRLQIGWLPLPPGAVEPMIRRVGPALGWPVADGLALARVVDTVEFTADAVIVTHRLSPAVLAQVREAVAPTASNAPRYRAQWELIAAISRDAGPHASLLAFLQPVFALAHERSARPGADAAAEHRAALLMLTLWATRRPPDQWVSGAASWPVPAPVELRLNDRPDTALHFLVSAVIASQADAELADAVGLWKELSDSAAGGSGFSFNDLAADRAGTLFGSLAVGRPRAFQEALGGVVAEADLMPATAGLAEGLTEADFIAQYGGAHGEGTQRVRVEIDRRLAVLPWVQRLR